MPENKPPPDEIDWRLTTWEGSRREQLRRWAQLPLEDIIRAIEEMQDISQQLGAAALDPAVQERPGRYDGDADVPSGRKQG